MSTTSCIESRPSVPAGPNVSLNALTTVHPSCVQQLESGLLHQPALGVRRRHLRHRVFDQRVQVQRRHVDLAGHQLRQKQISKLRTVAILAASSHVSSDVSQAARTPQQHLSGQERSTGTAASSFA